MCRRGVGPGDRCHFLSWIVRAWGLGVSTLWRHDCEMASLMEQVSRIKQRGQIDAETTANHLDSRKEARGRQGRELHRQSNLA